MKKAITLITILVSLASMVSCGNTSETSDSSSETSTSREVQATETSQESTVSITTDEETKLENFEHLLSFIETDVNLTDTMLYSIYIEKVYCTADYDETEIVVVVKGLDTATDTSYESTMAAEKNFREYYRKGGTDFDSVEQWWDAGTPYTAESIIAACLEEAGCSASDLVPYDQITLYSTFVDNPE